MFTRDSALWWLVIAAATFTYLANMPPPTTWTWAQWMATLAALTSTVAGVLRSSPLRGSKDGTTVDVSKLVPCVLLCLTLPLVSGCATTMKGKLHQADRSVQSALYTLDQVEDSAFKAGQVDAVFHKQFSKQMVIALTAGQTFHKSVMVYQPGQAIPVDVIQLAGALQSAADLVRSLPPSDMKAKIAAVLEMASKVASELMVLVLPQKQAAVLLPVPVFAH